MYRFTHNLYLNLNRKSKWYQNISKFSNGFVTALTSFFEEFFAVFAGEGNGARYVANELYDVSQVVFVPGVLLPRVGLKQVISCNLISHSYLWLHVNTSSELECHAGTGPDVSRWTVAGSEQDLERAILPRLDVLREVVMLPARVAQVSNLHLQVQRHLMDWVLQWSNFDEVTWIGLRGSSEKNGGKY